MGCPTIIVSNKLQYVVTQILDRTLWNETSVAKNADGFLHTKTHQLILLFLLFYRNIDESIADRCHSQ